MYMLNVNVYFEFLTYSNCRALILFFPIFMCVFMTNQAMTLMIDR